MMHMVVVRVQLIVEFLLFNCGYKTGCCVIDLVLTLTLSDNDIHVHGDSRAKLAKPIHFQW